MEIFSNKIYTNIIHTKYIQTVLGRIALLVALQLNELTTMMDYESFMTQHYNQKCSEQRLDFPLNLSKWSLSVSFPFNPSNFKSVHKWKIKWEYDGNEPTFNWNSPLSRLFIFLLWNIKLAGWHNRKINMIRLWSPLQSTVGFNRLHSTKTSPKTFDKQEEFDKKWFLIQISFISFFCRF